MTLLSDTAEGRHVPFDGRWIGAANDGAGVDAVALGPVTTSALDDAGKGCR